VLSAIGNHLAAAQPRAGGQQSGLAKASLPHPGPLPKGEGDKNS